MKEKTKFEYSPLEKMFGKQSEPAKNQKEKQIKAIKKRGRKQLTEIIVLDKKR